MKEGFEIKVSTAKNELIIDSKILKIREKIFYEDIEVLYIQSTKEIYNNTLYIHLLNRIKYENLGKNFLHKIVFSIFLFFHKNKKNIEVSYKDEDLILILSEVKKNLLNVKIPEKLKNSVNWKEQSGVYSIPNTSLIYSKNKKSLSEILLKYKKFDK